MRTAFKEWAIVADAPGRGEQIVILGKGGLPEGRGGFHAGHASFWLFATLFHPPFRQALEPLPAGAG